LFFHFIQSFPGCPRLSLLFLRAKPVKTSEIMIYTCPFQPSSLDMGSFLCFNFLRHRAVNLHKSFRFISTFPSPWRTSRRRHGLGLSQRIDSLHPDLPPPGQRSFRASIHCHFRSPLIMALGYLRHAAARFTMGQ
jgi:hypothetical protein